MAAGPTGASLWLAPAGRNVNDVRQSLLGPGLTACFSPQCHTFGQFAIRILAASATPLNALNRLGQREILRELATAADREGRLAYFRPIVDTAGFLDLLAGFIRELKRHEVWPEMLAERMPSFRRDAKLSELADLYARYQALLNERRLFDPEGRFWAARTLLAAGQTQPFDKLRTVFVDGFTDFTGAEHEILQILARRVERLVISLPLDEVGGQGGESRRSELFFKTDKTATQLSDRHRLETIMLPRASDRPPAFAFLEANIFRPPGKASAGAARPEAPELRGVELLVAASARGEIESIAARIKRLLLTGDARPAEERGANEAGKHSCNDRRDDTACQGVSCGEIMVVFRSLEPVEELVREVFRDYGIPLAMESHRRLGRCGVLSAISTLLRLEFEDWNGNVLRSALGNSYLRPRWPKAAAASLARRLQVRRGRDAWLEHASRATEPHSALGLRVLEQLADMVGALPNRATAHEWAAALERLADQAGIPRGADSPDAAAPPRDDPPPSLDAQAWQAAMVALRGADRLHGWLDRPARKLDRLEFWALWQDLLRVEPLPIGNDEAGRVRVLAAPAARGLSADFVFLAGLGEQSFPLAGGARSFLTDTEVDDLVKSGLPLSAREERGRAEMLLFYEALTRARRGLYLSYTALDSKAQPLMPSPYLHELDVICDGRLLAPRAPLHLRPLPEYRDPLSERDLRLAAVSRAADSAAPDASLLKSLLAIERPGLAANLRRGLCMQESRRAGEFGEFEGLVVSPAARARLAARFGPEALWSVSQLEQYVACPYQFFAQRVLRLAPLEGFELSADYMRRGSKLHGVLAGLHRRAHDRAGAPAALGDETQTLADAHELLGQLCSPPPGATPLTAALAEIDRRLLTTAVDRYLKQHGAYSTKMAKKADLLLPSHFEVAFGAREEPEEDMANTPDALATDRLSTTAPFRFDCGEEVVLLRGRIDRIDVGRVGKALVFNVLDYKSGKPIPRLAATVDEGLALQLPLYAVVASDLLLADKKATPLEVGYWFLKGSGYAMALACREPEQAPEAESEAWREFRLRLAAWVLAAVRGVRNGDFPVASRDDDCTSQCAYSTVCRINHVRSLGKVWPLSAGAATTSPAGAFESASPPVSGAPPEPIAKPGATRGRRSRQ